MIVSLGKYSCPFAPWRTSDGRVFDSFAYDTETTDIDDSRPYLTPSYVIGAACDGQRGVFISRENVPAFFQAHQGVPFVMHNAAFDLRVTDVLLRPELDFYRAVEDQQVWDTMILRRLLALATSGNTARGEASLADCCKLYLAVDLNKGQTDARGNRVRTSFGQFLGKPPRTIPVEYLTYLAQDALGTWLLYRELRDRIDAVLASSDGVWGYVTDAWLQDATKRFGPLTHHVQLKGSIVMDVLRSNGIGLDQNRCAEKAQTVEKVMQESRERMRQRGFLAGEAGSAKAMQGILTELKRENPDLELKRTASGKWSTAEEDLTELAARDRFFADYATYKTAEKLLSTYLRKMGVSRIHPRFGYLLETGRTYCGGGFNLQNLPKEMDEKASSHTVRGCFVPEDGKVFIDCDFSQIELVVLGFAAECQFGFESRLAQLINGGHDVHKLLAATMLGKSPDEVTKDQRSSVKPVSFGRPGGMGVKGLQRVAKNSYGINLTDEQVQQRIDAYHRLCPELNEFLDDERDVGRTISQALNLTPELYHRACGSAFQASDPPDKAPTGWLGGMLLKVLREPNPLTRGGRPYNADELDFFWSKAQELPVRWQPAQAAKLRSRHSHYELFEAVRDWAGRRSVFTVTGRLRANSTFCSSRNTVFQGTAADGAILALWKVWRAGYKLVDFVHDQLVVESPADDHVLDRLTHIEQLMKEGMAEVIPGMLIKIDSVVTCSLHKEDKDPRYQPKPASQPVTELRHDIKEDASHATHYVTA